MSRILVVDDDELVRELVVSKLTADGHDVTSAGDGEEGLAAALADPPDLVVLDSMMPKMSGPEVCQRLRDEPSMRGSRIIMLTARRQEADVVRGFAVGVDDYLVKPFSPSELVSRVRALLTGSAADPHPATETPEAGAPRPEVQAAPGPGDRGRPAEVPAVDLPADPATGGVAAASREVQQALRTLDTALDRLVSRLERGSPG